MSKTNKYIWWRNHIKEMKSWCSAGLAQCSWWIADTFRTWMGQYAYSKDFQMRLRSWTPALSLKTQFPIPANLVAVGSFPSWWPDEKWDVAWNPKHPDAIWDLSSQIIHRLGLNTTEDMNLLPSHFFSPPSFWYVLVGDIICITPTFSCAFPHSQRCEKGSGNAPN